MEINENQQNACSVKGYVFKTRSSKKVSHDHLHFDRYSKAGEEEWIRFIVYKSEGFRCDLTGAVGQGSWVLVN